MNDIYFTADTHFGHSPNQVGHGGIIFHAHRPFKNTDEMDQVLIDNWNKTIGKKDVVYIIGDFCWRNHGHYFHALNGKKILIVGSHDKMPQDILKNFTEVHKYLGKLIDKTLVIMFHWCLRTWQGAIHGSIHLYGHSHGRLPEYDDSMCCDIGVDVWDYFPVPWEVVKYKMSLKKKKEFDTREGIEDNVKINRERNLKCIEEMRESKSI